MPTTNLDRAMYAWVPLDSAEEAKVYRLQREIAAKFLRAGLHVRSCKATGTGRGRTVGFYTGVSGMAAIGTVNAAAFLAAPDTAAVAMIQLTQSELPRAMAA